MSARISGIGSPDRLGLSKAIDIDASHTKDLKSAESAKTKQMAQEFEAMFLRQILTSAKIGGESKSGGGNGYQSMGVDALASTISKSGGMGLAKQIEDIVARTEHRVIQAPGTASTVSATETPAAAAATPTTPTTVTPSK
jgi:Rod binding domain-containing protein